MMSRRIVANGNQKIKLRDSLDGLLKGDEPITLAMNLEFDSELAGWGRLLSQVDANDNGMQFVANSRFPRLRIQNGSAALDVQADAAVIIDTEEKFLVMSYDGSGEDSGVKMYVNQAPIAIHASYPNTLGALFDNSALPALLIDGLIGKVRNISAYGRVLTDAEAAALSDSNGVAVDPQTLPTSDDLAFQFKAGEKPDNKRAVHDSAGGNSGKVIGEIDFE